MYLINLLELNQMSQLGLYLEPPVPLFQVATDICPIRGFHTHNSGNNANIGIRGFTTT